MQHIKKYSKILGSLKYKSFYFLLRFFIITFLLPQLKERIHIFELSGEKITE